VRRWNETEAEPPGAFLLATDGFANSYPSDAEFLRTCAWYYAAIREHGAKTVARNLKRWLRETGESGSGDDITALFAYFGKDRD
jgi:serine/threonine protein phosphatase PrpC